MLTSSHTARIKVLYYLRDHGAAGANHMPIEGGNLYRYRPVQSLCRDGLIDALPDPRRADWTLYEINAAGRAALAGLS